MIKWGNKRNEPNKWAILLIPLLVALALVISFILNRSPAQPAQTIRFATVESTRVVPTLVSSTPTPE